MGYGFMNSCKKTLRSKRIILIIAAVMSIAGILMIFVGILQNGGGKFPKWDPFSVTDGDLNKKFRGEAECQVFDSEKTDSGLLCILIFENDLGNVKFVAFDVPSSEAESFEQPNISDDIAYIPFCGIVRRNDESVTEKISASISEWCDDMAEIGIELIYGKAELSELISPYYVEVTASANTKNFSAVGIVIVSLAVILALSALFGKKFLLVFAGSCFITIIIFIAVNFGKLATMASVSEISDGLYFMDCRYDYDCDKFLNADLGTIDELLSWIENEQFYGIKIATNNGNFGCSAFTAADENGNRLFGRNFDYEDTDTLIIYSEPKDAYASYAVSDLKFFGIGTTDGLEANSLAARAVMLAAPYICMDGINEKGVGVGILMLYTPEFHQDNGKTDLLVSAAIRGILDKCASVEEVIEFLGSYDIHSHLGCSYHLFITDKSGRAVVVEWSGNEMFVVEDTVCTNDLLSRDNEFYESDWNCERYDFIKNTLYENDNVLTKSEAMELLSAVKDNQAGRGTVWSCVYDLNNFGLDICVNRDYENVFGFDKSGQLNTKSD